VNISVPKSFSTIRSSRSAPEGISRRGFTIRLKRLKPRAPDFGGPQNFGNKDNFQHFCKHCVCIFVLVQRTFFTMTPTKDLYRRKRAKDDVTVAAHWVRLFAAVRFEDSATSAALAEASVFALQADGRAVTKLVSGYQGLDVRVPFLIFT